MIQVNRIYLIFNRLVTKKFLVDTSVLLQFYSLLYFTFRRLLCLFPKDSKSTQTYQQVISTGHNGNFFPLANSRCYRQAQKNQANRQSA